MAGFSIQDAAFTGFRLVREHPGAVVVWAALQFAASLVLFGGVFALAAPDLAQLMSLSMVAKPDPGVVIPLLQHLAPVFLMSLALSVVFNAVINAAMNRAILQPEAARFGFVRLGMDEARQLGLICLQLLVLAGVYIALVVVAGIVLALFTVAFKAAAFAVGILVFGAVLCAMAALLVRLSLAGPLTFDSGRVNLFGSWTLTRGRFWPLLGTYCLVGALVLVIYLLSLLVILAVAAVLTGLTVQSGGIHPKAFTLAAYLAPTMLVQTVLQAALMALLLPVALTPPAAIYRVLAPGYARGRSAADAGS